MDENTKAKIEHLLVKKNIPKYLLEQYKDYLLRYITEEFIAIIYFLTKGYLIEIDPHKEFLTKQLFYDPSITTMARTLNIPQRGHIYIYRLEILHTTKILIIMVVMLPTYRDGVILSSSLYALIELLLPQEPLSLIV